LKINLGGNGHVTVMERNKQSSIGEKFVIMITTIPWY